MNSDALGRIGVWWSGSWKTADAAGLDAAAELESMGYGALWSSGRFEPGLSPHFETLLASTSRIAVASGIVSIWAAAPEDVGAAVAELDERFPGRFLLGLGASHSVIVEGYEKPYSRMVEYLDALDALDRTVPPDRRVLAALGPRMLELAASALRRGSPVLRDGRAHGPGPRHHGRRVRCSRQRSQWSSTSVPPRPVPRPAGTPPAICSCRTMRRTSAPSVSAPRNSTGTGATA